jgi:hypothetical protein
LDRISPKRRIGGKKSLDISALMIVALGVGSLGVSFVEYTLARRKRENVRPA